MRDTSNRCWARRTAAVGGAALSAVVLGQLALTAPVAAVPGLVVKTSVGPSTSSAKTQNTVCPAGTKVIGGGAVLTGSGLGQVGLDIMLPLADANLYSVTGREDPNGVAGNWAVTTSAICAPAPTGLEVVTGHSATDSVNPKFREVSCPIGKRAIGGGGAALALGSGASDVLLEDVRIHLNSVTVAGVEAGGDFAGNWSLDIAVICADPLPGEQRLSTDSAFGSLASQSVTATCPAGTRVHGVGGEVVGGDGQVRLTELRPTSSTTVTVRAAEDENGFSGSWKVRAYAVCAT
ncbi:MULTISPECIES: hypothetical protein [Micromonospora]|uniref:Uncharacterized protein n=1 Tax=Micromonospora yangpuensis TaxID=683228 RepID=A0A1C6VGE4_9ACTN|nr:hypothetical protein [Micromonospora yangpuensis]GGL98845.1 hypothetical protein GCM10012279_15370 [Micromonospora yangpuensis]SCL65408.1 hypothetical protein GA0070617_5755 [Micromonospora yangpuensis]